MVADVNKQTLDQLKDTAKAIRRLIIKITTEAGSGHQEAATGRERSAAERSAKVPLTGISWAFRALSQPTPP